MLGGASQRRPEAVGTELFDGQRSALWIGLHDEHLLAGELILRGRAKRHSSSDADRYFGQVLREASSATRVARSGALRVYFEFLELRHKVEIHAMTGRVLECPVDEMNRPRGRKEARLRIPPRAEELAGFYVRWAEDLGDCRKFAPSARNYAATKLMSGVGLRVNEARCLDLDDVKWELGRFGKLHVRHGKGARRSGPRERMVPLIGDSARVLRWFIEDVWGQFDADHERHGAPLFPSERKNADGSGGRVGYDALRAGILEAAAKHLPDLDRETDPARAAPLLRLASSISTEWI